MSRYTGWRKDALGQAGEHLIPSSFTPINQYTSSLKSVPKQVRRHSGEYQQAVATDKHTSKRRKTETVARGASQNHVVLDSHQRPNALHLGTLPLKLKSSKKRRTSGKNSNHAGLFSEAPVTRLKQSVDQKPEPETIGYRGFITTENVVKSPIHHAQTTLEKLSTSKCCNDPAEVTSESVVKVLPANIHEDDSQFSMLLDGIDEEEILRLTKPQTMLLEHQESQALDGSHFHDAYFEGVIPKSHSLYHGSIVPADQSSTILVHTETDIVAMSASGPRLPQVSSSQDMEFDDSDINDEDLCAISSRVEEQKLNADHFNHTIEGSVSHNNVASLHEVYNPLCEQTSRNHPSHDDGDRSVCQEEPGSKVPSEFDDDFSINEEEMNELMMQVNMPMSTPHKTHSTPSNIPFPSEADSRDVNVFDRTLQHSSPPATAAGEQDDSCNVSPALQNHSDLCDEAADESWSFVIDKHAGSKKMGASKDQEDLALGHHPPTQSLNHQGPAHSTVRIEDDAYPPLKPFARPEFPAPMSDRSPIIGFSGSLVLRTCFRIGEALRVAAISTSASHEVMFELFARVAFSSREKEGTFKQHFQFADIFHDRPPFLEGLLENYKASDLANDESKQLLENSGTGQLVRCLGKMRRESRRVKRALIIENIRATDWEEICRTKMIIEDLNGKVPTPHNDHVLQS